MECIRLLQADKERLEAEREWWKEMALLTNFNLTDMEVCYKAM